MTANKTLLVLTTSLALLTAGCGGSDNESTPATTPAESTVHPSDMSDVQAPPERLVLDVTIAGDEVKPVNEQLEAGVNEQIVINVTSDSEDELHVHSNPEHTFAVKPGPKQTFQFTVAVPGRVDVELHNAGTTIVTIAVQ